MPSGTEQDRYGGWLGGNKADQIKDSGQHNVLEASAAKKDQYDGWFGGGKVEKVKDSLKQNMGGASGAEQDRYSGWFSGGAEKAKDAVRENLPKTSGAEQDRYGGWFGRDKGIQVGEAVEKRIPQGSGAEQDRYGGWFGGDRLPSRSDVERRLPRTSGAEQDRYGGWFRSDKLPSQPDIESRLPHTSGAEQDRYGSRLDLGRCTTTTLGLLQGAVLPSFGLHAGLGAVAYGVARYTDRAEGKDWLWPSGQVANAWWSTIGSRMVHDGLSIWAAWAALTYSEKLLLTGVSAWGIRLFYHTVSRSLRRGKDDARYEEVKRQPGFWNKAFFTMFLPEAVAQTLIALPFTLPFRAPVASAAAAPIPEFPSTSHSLAIFLFTAGFALETLADSQLETHIRNKSSTLNREGMWSIVRHPNYLGDALCHFSFPVLLYSAGLLHPLVALGPAVNYLFLRFVGGDKENEASQDDRYAKENPLKFQQLQDYRQTKNSFWPSVHEIGNKWVWIVAAAGAGGVIVEQGARSLLSR